METQSAIICVICGSHSTAFFLTQRVGLFATTKIAKSMKIAFEEGSDRGVVVEAEL